MKSFLFKVALFVLLQGVIFSVFWNPKLPREMNYLAANVDKHNRLAGTRPPRIIFVGGSNLAFGINCDTIQNELGRSVVNMGLVAGLGINFLLREVEPHVRAGVNVVLSIEYDVFDGGHDDLVLREVLEIRPASVRFVPPAQWKKLITEYGFQLLGGVVRRALLPHPTDTAGSPRRFAYERRQFNLSGCYIGHLGSSMDLTSVPPDSPLLAKTKIRPISEKTVRQIEGFAALCHKRGAWCLYTCPPHPAELLLPDLATIEANVARLQSIPYLLVLDRPTDQVYPMKKFYDTRYHLTQSGAIERTRKVIAEVKSLGDLTSSFTPRDQQRMANE